MTWADKPARAEAGLGNEMPTSVVIAQQGSGRDPAQSVAVLRGTDGLLPALGIDRTTGLAFAPVIAPVARFRPPQ